MLVIYMHNSFKVCGPTTMKPTFYKPVLVFFLGIETESPSPEQISRKKAE